MSNCGSVKPRWSDLWRWDGDLTGGTYLFWGITLAAIKFNLDRCIAYVWFGQSWTLFASETWRFYLWQSLIDRRVAAEYLVLLVVSLPFLWTGTALTLRRLLSLGWNPFWLLLFFVPVVKLLFFAILGLVPSGHERGALPASGNQWIGLVVPRGRWKSAFAAVVLTSVLTAFAAWASILLLRDYGWTIFVGLPFCLGFLAVLLDSFHEPRSLSRCMGVANAAVLLVGAGMLLFAIEGVLCLLMTAPIAFAVASVGALLGFTVQRSFHWQRESPELLCSLLVLVPVAMALEHAVPPSFPLLSVTSSIIVDAPPATVWRNVVSFAELPPPVETIFRWGVAYPVRAEISGTGVGAVRKCHFSTGAFIEPIEVWDEPRLLKFAVTHNPAPMQEWTPYQELHPPHLDGYLESRGGQFRLVPIAGGRTLLEGTTWYYHHLWPADYWQIWSDWIIHTIHLRVLNHIRWLSEKGTA